MHLRIINYLASYSLDDLCLLSNYPQNNIEAYDLTIFSLHYKCEMKD